MNDRFVELTPTAGGRCLLAVGLIESIVDKGKPSLITMLSGDLIRVSESLDEIIPILQEAINDDASLYRVQRDKAVPAVLRPSGSVQDVLPAADGHGDDCLCVRCRFEFASGG